MIVSRFASLSVALIGLLFFCSCNQGIIEFSGSQSFDSTVAEEIIQPPLAMCCIEGENSCYLGYEFSPYLRDDRHRKGGYLVKRIVGECECKFENGEWNVISTGNINIYSGVFNSLNMALCDEESNQLSRSLFGSLPDSKEAEGQIPNPPSLREKESVMESWDSWMALVLNELQQMTNPPGTTPIRVVNIPPEWNISISEPLSSDLLRITLATQAQADQLRRIRVFPNGSITSLIQVPANVSQVFDVDISSLSDGLYQVKLDFWPGFQLVETVRKTSSSN